MQPEINIVEKEDIVAIVHIVTDTVLTNEVYFCELDSAAGDGDFGMSLAKGFKVIKEDILDKDQIKDADIGSFFRRCGMVLIENCGGASGPLWGTAFLEAGKYSKAKNSLTLQEFAELGEAFVYGVQKRGKAIVGDKTLLDALIPAVLVLKESAQDGGNFISAMGKAVKAAEAGTEATKIMVAKKGRATYLGERSIKHPDAGAVAISVIIKDVYEQFFLTT